MVDITVKDWCELFLTCFQSPVLKRRCLKDFYFYSRLFLQPPRPQAFTFEIGTYLSATRIQVNYCRYWYHHYRFIVNIIHCDSAGTYNGSGTYLMFGYDFLHKKLMLFRVVGSCQAKFETVKLFQSTTSNILFRSVVQQCWIRFYNSSDIVGANHAHYACLQSLMGCILSTMHCRSQYCLELSLSLIHI